MNRFFILCICILLMLSSCGYHIGSIKPTSMRECHSLAIKNFQNATLIPRIEVQTSDILVKQFQQDGTYKIDSTDQADAIIDGRILNIEKQPMRVFSNNVLRTSEFLLIVTIEYRIFDRVSRKILMQGRAIGSSPFFVDADSVYSDVVTLERMNYPLVARSAAEVIVNHVSEGW